VKWLFFAVAMFLAMPSNAKDVSLLVDVSGSMSQYGPWQDDALSLVKDILRGKRDASQSAWRLIGNHESVADFSISSGDGLHLVLFGSISLSAFPYFRTFDLNGTADLQGAFPQSERLYREARTNKPLAIAVGARLAAPKGGMAQLIVVSDFLNDSLLNKSEWDFVNKFEAQAEQSSPVTFSWSQNPNVQVKLMKVTLAQNSTLELGNGQTPPPPAPGGFIQLFTPQFLPGGQRAMQFRWRLSDSAKLLDYMIEVVDQRTGRLIIHRAGLITATFIWAHPPSGAYGWRVIATREDQSEITSPLLSFKVTRTATNGGAVLAFLLLLGVAAVVWFIVHRRNQRIAAEQLRSSQQEIV
jgi:hypothetical protein